MALIRDAIAKLKVDGSEVARGLNKAKGRFDKFGKKVGRQLKTRIGGALKSALKFGVGGLGIGAGIGLVSFGKEALGFEDKLQRLGSQARKSAKEMEPIREALTEISKETGVARDELLGAADVLVDRLGKEALTTDNLQLMAQQMLGTGTAAEDLANLMFTLESSMGINTTEKMKESLGGLDKIGTAASIPLKELASSVQEALGASQSFGEKGPRAVFGVVAALQAMRRGGIASADETRTAFTKLATEIFEKRKKINKVLKKKGLLKLDIEDSEGNKKNLIGGLEQLLAAELSDAEIAPIFGVRAEKGFNALKKNKKLFEEFLAAGEDGAGFFDERAAERAASSAGKIQKSMNAAKLSILEAFTPERIEAFSSALQTLVGSLGEVASTVSNLIDRAVNGSVKQTGTVRDAQQIELTKQGVPLSEQVSSGLLGSQAQANQQLTDSGTLTKAQELALDFLRNPIDKRSEGQVTSDEIKDAFNESTVGKLASLGGLSLGRRRSETDIFPKGFSDLLEISMKKGVEKGIRASKDRTDDRLGGN